MRLRALLNPATWPTGAHRRTARQRKTPVSGLSETRVRQSGIAHARRHSIARRVSSWRNRPNSRTLDDPSAAWAHAFEGVAGFITSSFLVHASTSSSAFRPSIAASSRNLASAARAALPRHASSVPSRRTPSERAGGLLVQVVGALQGGRRLLKLAGTTEGVAKRVRVAKAVFRKAVRWGYIASSPFADLRAGSQANPDRSFYVPAGHIHAVLAACPDDEWRAIIALSRFAGLRCPSEVAALRWGDIVWDKRRMTVRSPKTAGHEGHAARVVPIVPDLLEILQRLFDRAEVGVEAIVPRLRETSINLWTQFERIIAKAGLKPWPRLFHNLRASCATDWVERFPNHTVASWLGHSPLIAAQHYLHTRDTHFDLAAGIVPEGVQSPSRPEANPAASAAAKPAAHTRPRKTTAGQGATKAPEIQADFEGSEIACASMESGKVTPMDSNPCPYRERVVS